MFITRYSRGLFLSGATEMIVFLLVYDLVGRNPKGFIIAALATMVLGGICALPEIMMKRSTLALPEATCALFLLACMPVPFLEFTIGSGFLAFASIVCLLCCYLVNELAAEAYDLAVEREVEVFSEGRARIMALPLGFMLFIVCVFLCYVQVGVALFIAWAIAHIVADNLFSPEQKRLRKRRRRIPSRLHWHPGMSGKG